LFTHFTALVFSLTDPMPGKSNAAKIAMIAIVTNSSINVKACCRQRSGFPSDLLIFI
jgi:hypothetical protein